MTMPPIPIFLALAIRCLAPIMICDLFLFQESAVGLFFLGVPDVIILVIGIIIALTVGFRRHRHQNREAQAEGAQKSVHTEYLRRLDQAADTEVSLWLQIQPDSLFLQSMPLIHQTCECFPPIRRRCHRLRSGREVRALNDAQQSGKRALHACDGIRSACGSEAPATATASHNRRYLFVERIQRIGVFTGGLTLFYFFPDRASLL